MVSRDRVPTGISGLDEVLCGGLPANQLYLIQGKPGTGKTTLALQFLLEGVRQKERSLYITFSETHAELENVAKSHGWDLSHIDILELSAISAQTSKETKNTLFNPSEIELKRVIDLLLEKIAAVNPVRIVFDSVSELRLLAETSLKYRRQMLAFKEFFIHRKSTVLFLDDLTTEAGDVHVQSIVHGVVLLEKFRAAYGVERRQVHIVKLRGVAFRGGTHDYLILHGGVKIFPRLVASEHTTKYENEVLSSGVPELDHLLGGGLDRGTSNLLLGPAGSGKSTISLKFALSACERGQRAAIYSFEESINNLVMRGEKLGLEVRKHLDSGHLVIRKIDPAELTPGQFASLLLKTTENSDVDMVIVDSLNGYIHAMPEQQFLMLQLHELLAFLANQGIVTILVLAQAGIMGQMQTPLDLTYLADTVVLTRYFEARGHVKKAISVLKKRSGPHEETLRELKIGQGGVKVGPILSEFRGIFTGVPVYSDDATSTLKEPK